MLLLMLLVVVTCVQGRLIQTDEQTREMIQDIAAPPQGLPELLKHLGDKNESERCTVDRWLAKTCTCRQRICTCKVNPSPFSIVDSNLKLTCKFVNFHNQWSCEVVAGTRCHAKSIYKNTIPRNESSTVDSGCIQTINGNIQMEICVIIECQDASLAELEAGKVRGCARLSVNYDSTKSGIRDTVDVNFGCFRIP